MIILHYTWGFVIGVYTAIAVIAYGLYKGWFEGMR